MLTIEHGKIFTITRGIINDGFVLVEGVMIKEISDRPFKGNFDKIDATGKLVFPGFIDAHSHLGLFALESSGEGFDGNEMSNPSTAAMRAIDAINPQDPAYKDAISAGITTVFTGPGSGNVIGGQSVIMRTYGNIVDDMIIRNPAGLKCAFGENPKRVYREKGQLPSTRMGTAKVFRETLSKAKQYHENKKKKKKVDFDLNMEAFLPIFDHKIPLRIHSHRADDIVTAVRIAKHEFGLDIRIEHGTDSVRVRDFLAKEKVPVITGPLLDVSPKVETRSASFENPTKLVEAGVLTALMTDHPVIPIQYLPIQTGIVAYQGGLGEEKALELITINAAKILEIDKDYGSIEKGKVANISIYSGHPFSTTGKCECVIAEGEVVFNGGKHV
jgi:imidazolonepropionase-like amidohydrolase